MTSLTPAQARKALVAAIAFVANLIAQGVLPDEVAAYATAVIAALTAIGVYAVPNAPAEAEDPEGV